jgi:hypothetical protein
MMMNWVTSHEMSLFYLHIWRALDFVGCEKAMVFSSALQLATLFEDVSIRKRVMGSQLHMGGC